MSPAKRTDVPPYQNLIYPTLVAVAALGGSAQGREITSRVLEDIQASDELVAITYESRPKSVLIDRLEWARSYAKLGGALDSPQRGLYVLSTLGRDTLARPEQEGIEFILAMNREVRASRARSRQEAGEESPPVDEGEIEAEGTGWTEVLLDRLHRLTPEGFEEFVMYLLRTYDL
jgi:restriction system protein